MLFSILFTDILLSDYKNSYFFVNINKNIYFLCIVFIF